MVYFKTDSVNVGSGSLAEELLLWSCSFKEEGTVLKVVTCFVR